MREFNIPEDALQLILTAASDEANARYKGDWDEYNKEPVDDWGYSESERHAFVAGALFAVENPHLRRAIIAELITKAETGPTDGTHDPHAAYWLRAELDGEG